jgi:hypothetical protein
MSILKSKIAMVVFAIGALFISACGSNVPSQPAYNNSWGQQYYNGTYNPFFNYGLGTYQQNGRTYYNTPSIVPPAGVSTARTPFRTTAPMPTNQPKPSTQPAKPSSKPKPETAKPNKPSAPKPKAPSKPSKPK